MNAGQDAGHITGHIEGLDDELAKVFFISETSLPKISEFSSTGLINFAAKFPLKLHIFSSSWNLFEKFF